MEETLNNYINENYYILKKKLRNIAKGADNSTYEDLYHHSLEILLGHQRTQEALENNQIQFFLARIMLNQWRTNRSDFRRFDVKHTTLDSEIQTINENYDTESDYLIEIILDSLDKMLEMSDLDKSRAMIIIYYYSSNCNFNEVERRYGIKSSTARHSHKHGLITLQNIIKQHDLFTILNIGFDLGGDTFISTLSKSARLFKKEIKV